MQNIREKTYFYDNIIEWSQLTRQVFLLNCSQEWTDKESFSTVSQIEAVQNSGMVTAVRLAAVIEEQPQQVLILSTYESGLLMLSTIFGGKSATAVATFQFRSILPPIIFLSHIKRHSTLNIQPIGVSYIK